jgi:type II secretory pathway component PulF
MSVLALVAPKFEMVFSGSGVKLPTATAALLWASRICVRGYLWAVFLPLPALWAVSTSNVSNKNLRRRRFLTAFLFVAAFLSFSVLALLIPLAHLPQDLAAR